ncbi:C-type mannose receptor 2-like [Gambusia affinis]|uniref:C-type mannose receptor 2-like n=1 Tax=Gambusia affinis TaxID=33528 RepID=UPI001CDB5EE8|nr:C-type mannose receptor 2-like [Gambusia affinis]
MKLILFLLVLLGKCCFMDCQFYQYLYINQNKNWTEAQQYCRQKHTDLATVTNMKDMERLNSISAGYQREAWIGLYDQTNGIRKWYWSLPGVEFNESETKWNPGEPNDYQTENCGCISKDLKWNDISCNQEKYFLCYNETKTSDKIYLIKETKSWLEAQSYCRKEHTDLVSGLNQLNHGQLKNVLTNNWVGEHQYVFMDLFRDTWRWSDGTSFSFRHWNLKFNDEQDNSGQCALVEFSDEGSWRNEKCTERKPFICYDDKLILVTESKTWEEALNYCREKHHDLVTITNMDDQRWIQEKVKVASTDFVWTGLSYACTLDLWFWVSDEVVSYKNWAEGEPMDDCDMSGAMETRGKHQWRKKNDTETFNFICSKHTQG